MLLNLPFSSADFTITKSFFNIFSILSISVCCHANYCRPNFKLLSQARFPRRRQPFPVVALLRFGMKSTLWCPFSSWTGAWLSLSRDPIWLPMTLLLFPPALLTPTSFFYFPLCSRSIFLSGDSIVATVRALEVGARGSTVQLTGAVEMRIESHILGPLWSFPKISSISSAGLEWRRVLFRRGICASLSRHIHRTRRDFLQPFSHFPPSVFNESSEVVCPEDFSSAAASCPPSGAARPTRSARYKRLRSVNNFDRVAINRHNRHLRFLDVMLR